MTEEKIPEIMREFVNVMAEGDVEKTLSLFTEDAEFICPNGTFKGQEELRRYMAVQSQTIQEQRRRKEAVERKERLRLEWSTLSKSRQDDLRKAVASTANSYVLRRLSREQYEDPLVELACLDELERQLNLDDKKES